MSSHLPSISKENLPVGYQVVVDGYRYQVTLSKGKRPRRYWKKIGPALPESPTVSNEKKLSPVTKMNLSTPKQLKVSARLFDNNIMDQVDTYLKSFNFHYMPEPLSALLRGAMKYLHYYTIPATKSNPDGTYVFKGFSELQEVIDAVRKVCLAITYDLWLRIPDTYMYAKVFPRPPSVYNVYYLYDEKYVDEVGKKLPDKTIFRTHDYRGRGVHYTYEGRIYHMAITPTARLAVSLKDMERMTLRKLYTIAEDNAIYQLTPNLWFNAPADEMCKDRDCYNIIEDFDWSSLDDNPIYQTLIKWIDRTEQVKLARAYIITKLRQ